MCRIYLRALVILKFWSASELNGLLIFWSRKSPHSYKITCRYPYLWSKLLYSLVYCMLVERQTVRIVSKKESVLAFTVSLYVLSCLHSHPAIKFLESRQRLPRTRTLKYWNVVASSCFFRYFFNVFFGWNGTKYWWRLRTDESWQLFRANFLFL